MILLIDFECPNKSAFATEKFTLQMGTDRCAIKFNTYM